MTDAVRRQHVVALGAQARQLVHLQPEAVAQPVAEEVAEALGGDQVARDRVDLAAARARAYRLERRQLRAQADVVRARQLVRQVAGRERARAVRAVVAELGRRVDDDRLASLDHPVARAGVRLRAARACPDDHRECGLVRPELAHQRLEPPGELLLGSADEGLLGQPLEALVRDRGSAADRLQLARLP